MSADIGCGRTMDAVPSVIVASVCINPRLAADRPLRACPARPRAKTGPRMRVSAASRQVHEFVHGDEACAFGSFGTELDRRFVQTYRHGIAVCSDPAVPFRTRARWLSQPRGRHRKRRCTLPTSDVDPKSQVIRAGIW